MRRWLYRLALAVVAVSAVVVIGAGVEAMTEGEREPGLPFDSPEECEQYQIDHRVWLPPEACDPSVFTGDNP